MLRSKKLDGYSRFDLLKLFGDKTGLRGIELGVAAGDYSAKMIQSGKFSEFFGVDIYGDTHDTAQYKTALSKIGIFTPYKLLRMRFEDALDLFPDECFDFVYLDGYASTGLEGGRTIRDWASKVKIGGVLSGDDYHEDFPLLIEVVNELCEQNDLELMVTEGASDQTAYGHYPSWAVIKTAPIIGETSQSFLDQGAKLGAKARSSKLRAKKLDMWLRKIVPAQSYAKLRTWNRARKERRKSKR